MPQRASHRRRQPGGAPAAPELLGHDNPVLALQRSIGNRAVAQMIARDPVRTGTVEIAGVGAVKVKGGNLEEWAGKGTPDTVELTSQKGKHSGKLEKLSTARTKTDVKITIAPANQAGEDLNVGGGTLLEITGARVTGYSVADGVETWRVTNFTNVKRTKITHTIGSG
jgi:hypothetical protein